MPAFFDFLEAHAAALVDRDRAAMEQVIRRSAALHLRHIATCGDPFELGSSRPLDFGHWAAHKLEQLTEHRMRHGEAVGIGIALDSTYSHLAGYLPEAAWRRIVDLLVRSRTRRSTLTCSGRDGSSAATIPTSCCAGWRSSRSTSAGG